MSKFRVYLMGIFTLLMLPVGWVICGLPNIWDFLNLELLLNLWTLKGIFFGVCFGIVMLKLLENGGADKSFEKQIGLIRSMNLSFLDCIFLGLCAGIGEEFLFRVAAQEYLHPVLASVLFVAIHGYLDPRDWDTTRFGLILLLFIVALGYGLSIGGIWFCVAAHASYDVVLLHAWTIKSRDTNSHISSE